MRGENWVKENARMEMRERRDLNIFWGVDGDWYVRVCGLEIVCRWEVSGTDERAATRRFAIKFNYNCTKILSRYVGFGLHLNER